MRRILEGEEWPTLEDIDDQIYQEEQEEENA
jgi:hypothetical protein